MSTLEDLSVRLQKIEARNKSVEINKAWETSYTRRFLIALFTYLAIALYLQFIVGVDPWINAIVPTVGFLLSTLTLPYFKYVWVRFIYKSK
jgi:hypothetical protein